MPSTAAIIPPCCRAKVVVVNVAPPSNVHDEGAKDGHHRLSTAIACVVVIVLTWPPNEIHMTLSCEPGRSFRREHVAQSFEAMVDEMGLHELLTGNQMCGIMG